MDYEEFGLPGETPEPEEQGVPEELEDWCICDIHYRATKSQANEISRLAYETDAWLDYAQADDLMRHTPNLPTMTLQDWRGIVAERALAWRRYYETCRLIVDQVLG